MTQKESRFNLERIASGIDQPFPIGIARNGEMKVFSDLRQVLDNNFVFVFGVGNLNRANALLITVCKRAYDGETFLHNRAHELSTADNLRAHKIIEEIAQQMREINQRLSVN